LNTFGEDVLVGKVVIKDNDTIKNDASKKNRIDTSLRSRRAELGVVETVMISENGSGYKIVKVIYYYFE
jgi:DNA-directed RNA polymerase II subunit RPB2